MKTLNYKLFTLLICVSLFIGCKKTNVDIVANDTIESRAKEYLKSQLNQEDFEKVDWKRLKEYKKSNKTEIIRVPLLGSYTLEDKAIYLRVVGKNFEGNYYQQIGKTEITKIITTSFNNNRICIAEINKNKFDGKYELIENGNHTYNTSISSMAVHNVPVGMLFNFNLAIWIQMLGIGQPGWYSNGFDNYVNLEYIEPDGSGTNVGNNTLFDLIEFELDDPDSKPSVNIAKLFNCFDLVPSGPTARFNITLNSDIPSNGNENTAHIFGNPGHAFLTITKTNGPLSVTQNFGFYPQSGPQSLTLNNVPSKIVDDTGHEINASIKMIDINEASFNLIRYNAIYEATQTYNLSTNNCAHFAIKLFNLARSNDPINVANFPVTVHPLIAAPSFTIDMSSSPHKLYNKLDAMKNSGHPEASNIMVNRNHSNNSGISHGECP